MNKRLKDGEKNVIKASRQFSMWKHNQFKVEAERYDCDTPFVHLHIGCDSAIMNDIEAMDLIDRLQRALSVLPTSK